MTNMSRNTPGQPGFSAASLLNPRASRGLANGGHLHSLSANDFDSTSLIFPHHSPPPSDAVHHTTMSAPESSNNLHIPVDATPTQPEPFSFDPLSSSIPINHHPKELLVSDMQVDSQPTFGPDEVGLVDMQSDSDSDSTSPSSQKTLDHDSMKDKAYVDGVEGRAKTARSSPSRASPAKRSPSFEQPPNSLQPNFVFVNTSNLSNGNVSDDETSADRLGQANLLEKTHGLSAREGGPPAKKLKTDQVIGESRSFQETSGDVGQWLKEQKAELRDSSGPIQIVDDGEDEESSVRASNGAVVDLTADENDKTEQLSHEDKEVCYGKIDGAQVNAHRIPHPKDHNGVTGTNGETWKPLPCTLYREPLRHHIINVRDPHGKIFANVDVRVSRALAPLLDTKFLRLRVDARLDPRKRRPTDAIGNMVSEFWRITLNLYGPRKHSVTVGKALSQKNVWLATPYGVKYGIEIMNPHAADRAAKTKNNWTQRLHMGAGGPTHVVRTNEEVAQDLNGIFNSLSNSEELDLLEPTKEVKTALLDHQKRGLRFMTNRETVAEAQDTEGTVPGNPLWRMRISGNGRKSYYNAITGNEQPHAPDPVLGGILADQMGLGKTLEAIAFIHSTLEEARKWADTTSETDEQGIQLKNVKTTLLICPKNVCSEWQDQINTHLKKNTLKTYFYHGSDRCRDIKILAEYDVVITTYSIVANELRRANSSKENNSIFAVTRWFRIVLDEAHFIREQSTQQSRAICSLAASRRWALTGTPVQNRLEDLGALVKFLRIKPFDDPSAFVQYIMTSFKLKDQHALQKLRLLVDSFTLRRLKDKINLPPREEFIKELEFRADEAALHNWFTKDAGNKMRMMQSKKRTLAGRSYQNVLRSILCLRLVSVHGRELLHEDDLQMIQGISSEQPIDLEMEEAEPALTARAAYEMLMLLDSAGRQLCNRCGKSVRPREDEDDKNAVFGTMLPCYDVVCNDCIKEVKQNIEETARDERFSCPFCETSQKVSFFALTQAGVEAAEIEREQAKLNPRQAKILGRYRGPHTKTMALLHHLQQDAEESAAAIAAGETPVKSVVFTEWTSHMDLIEIALEDSDARLKTVRFDGKMTVKQQNAALKSFRDDPTINAIIVSIRAGGVGLNLTAACRVYVMEPQWNPAAEAQAVDRVHRLGQKRAVRIIRFIMSNSIEQTMLKLQGKKKRLAEVSLNKNVGRGALAAETMDEFRELFSRKL